MANSVKWHVYRLEPNVELAHFPNTQRPHFERQLRVANRRIASLLAKWDRLVRKE